MRFVTLFIISLIIFPPSAQACRGLSSETRTFLPTLPEAATSKNIVAKVKIISTVITAHGERESEVQVIEPIKGVTAGERLRVISETHSCASDHSVSEHERFFIAGALDDEQKFHGVWSSLENAF